MDERIRVPADTLRDTLAAGLIRQGLSGEDARTVAEALTEAEMRGRPTHGLVRLAGLVAACGELSSERPHVVEDRGATACVDGMHHLGYVACTMAADEAAARALRYGVAAVGVRRTRHTGMLGLYVERIARRGLVGLGFGDCCPLVAPWGGVEPVLGTNPIAAAFPREPDPVLMDLGTGAITYGEVMLRKHTGEPLPAGVALDAEGRPTSDPAAACEGALLPFAGHKGYALALIVQLLSGALTGAEGVPVRREEYGALFLALRRDAFGPSERVDAEAGRLVAAIKSSRRMAGVGEILLPGERGWRERARCLREGVAVPEALWREAQRFADGRPRRTPGGP